MMAFLNHRKKASIRSNISVQYFSPIFQSNISEDISERYFRKMRVFLLLLASDGGSVV